MPQTVISPEPIEAPDKEAEVKRNPHEDFAAVEAGRPPYNTSLRWEMSKTPRPNWRVGDGATTEHCKDRNFLSIDPQEDGRSVVLNYKLMISCTVPRPIALVSTVTKDGLTKNLAPFSYFQCVTTDVSISQAGKYRDTVTDRKTRCYSLRRIHFHAQAESQMILSPTFWRPRNVVLV